MYNKHCGLINTDVSMINISQKIPGVLAFFSAKDIPGENNFLSQRVPGQLAPEEIFVEKTVKYYDQPIGVIVAETEKLANQAALLVQVKYKVEKKKPLLTINEIRKEAPERVSLYIVIPARDRGTNVERIIKGSDNILGQYVYPMETLSTVTRPNETGLDVTASTQWTNSLQVAISKSMNMEQNR